MEATNPEFHPLNPPPSYTSFEKYTKLPMKDFLATTNEVRFNLQSVRCEIEKIRKIQRTILDNTVLKNTIVKENRSELQDKIIKTIAELNHIKNAIEMIEPSKPSLTDLDIRNSHFKDILSQYKDILEDYITCTLEHQRHTSHLFEEQIKVVNPLVTSFDLERAISSSSSSTDDDEPSVFLKVLMQRGIRKNDEKAQYTMKIVLEIHLDLRLIFSTFDTLSALRAQVNIIVERYRRRWPVVIKDKDFVYVIDDDLNLLEKTHIGTVIDFEKIIKRRDARTRLTFLGLTLMMVLILLALIVLITLYWAGKIF